MPTERITRLALRVLIDAAARSYGGSVERNWGHRLALEWLVEFGIAERWQAQAFWDDLVPEWGEREFEHNAAYIQTTALVCAVTAWSRRLGLEAPDPVLMQRLSRAYFAELDFGSGTPQALCMCNRYTPGTRDTIQRIFEVARVREANDGPAVVHPREPGWVVRLDQGERVLEQMNWGFPVHLRGKAGQPLKPRPVNNARFDKLNSYWKHWAAQPAQRCLIPATAYAEAVGPAGKMRTTWLSVKDRPVFAWAGLWRSSDEWGACYTGVMTDNDPTFAAIHDRSPVILEPGEWDVWLNAPLEELRRFDRPYPAARMRVTATDILWKHGGSVPPPL